MSGFKLTKMNFKGKKICITGGTGYLATNLVKHLLANGCEYIRLTSRDEVKQAQRFEEFNKDSRLNYILSDVRNYKSTEYSLHDIDLCIHTAAGKRIDAGERNPMEFVDTNVLGTKNVIDACIHNNVEKAVFISSDKACQPISMYGSTKFTAEKLWSFANHFSGAEGTKFSSVRYGNVYASTGSLHYIFKKQLESNQRYFTITHPEMTRYFIEVDRAIQTIEFALVNMNGNGEIYIPKIPSFRITDLATAFCEDFSLKTTGLRGIEKMSEVLIAKEEMLETNEFDKYYEILPIKPIHMNRSSYPHNEWKDCEEYSSMNNKAWLTINDLKEIVKRYGIL